MWRCECEREKVKMWVCEDVKMSRCEDEKMWRWADVKMSRCEDEQMWRWEGVKMWRWEGVREGVKMRRWDTDPHYWKNPALRRSREKWWFSIVMLVCQRATGLFIKPNRPNMSWHWSEAACFMRLLSSRWGWSWQPCTGMVDHRVFFSQAWLPPSPTVISHYKYL